MKLIKQAKGQYLCASPAAYIEYSPMLKAWHILTEDYAKDRQYQTLRECREYLSSIKAN